MTPVSPRILVAGIGNLFVGDDGFGVEVARRLAESPPEGAVVEDFGIRGLHLAFSLLDGWDLLIAVDAMPRGQPPGTLFVLDPATEPGPAVGPDAHGMQLPAVFALLRGLGGTLPKVRVVGCEPANLDDGIGLSEPVAGAVDGAVELVRRLVAEERAAAEPVLGATVHR